LALAVEAESADGGRDDGTREGGGMSLEDEWEMVLFEGCRLRFEREVADGAIFRDIE
jgi:hypothetical protein